MMACASQELEKATPILLKVVREKYVVLGKGNICIVCFAYQVENKKASVEEENRKKLWESTEKRSLNWRSNRMW